MRYLLTTMLTTSLFAADLTTVRHLPASRWRIEAGPKDKVKLTAEDEVLVIDYDVEVADWHQIGHQSLKQKSIRLLLSGPVRLPAEARRIVFEAWGHQVGTWKMQDRVTQFRPLLRDANGEWLSYTAHRFAHLKNAGETWAHWQSSHFFAGEAGGAQHDVLEADGGDGNAWPDGGLQFAGFEIVVRRPEFGRRQGKLALGLIGHAGARQPYADPFVFADSLLKESGRYRVATRIATGFQGPSRRESSTEIVFDADSLTSARQKISFPLGPDGQYWIAYQITDSEGQHVAGDSMRTRALGNPKTQPLPKVPADQPPAMGHLRVNYTSHIGGVYKAGEPLAVAARVFPKNVEGLLS